MTTRAETILQAASIEQDPAAHGLGDLAEHPAFGTEAFVAGVTPLRKFLGCPPDIGGKRAGRAFYEVFCRYGRRGAEALLAAFEAELPDDQVARERYAPTWRAAAHVARIAKNEGLVSWSLDDWKPLAYDATKRRFSGYLSLELDDQTRMLAVTTRRSLSEVLVSALCREIEFFESRRGKLPVRPAEITAPVEA